MAKIIAISIAKKFKGNMQSVPSIEAIAGKGLVGDRYFKENNQKHCQITLIEIENINYYNQISKSSILPIDFRRNIVTEGIKLNDLVGSEFFIGEVRIKVHNLCRPCKYLQERLKQKDLVKEFLQKGGLRCEILTSGTIFIGNTIKY